METKNLIGTDRVLRLGLVPLTDCAPLVLAHELGLFGRYGLRVVLQREWEWATIRDKIIFGELEGAHALAAMPVAAALGLGSVRCECLTALVLSLHGNAITLSNRLWRRGVRDGISLRAAITHARHEKQFTFGVVHPFSSHRHLLRKWLAAHGIDAEREVRVVIVPPPRMVSELAAGNLDGFCAGEPWNSLAVQSGSGWCVATSAELAPGHPEKVLMVRRDWAEEHPAEHLALVAALLEACAFCDRPENADHVSEVLARPEYVATPAAALRPGLTGQFDFGHNCTRPVPDFCVFRRNDANDPSGSKAAWALELVRASGLCRDPAALNFSLGRSVFRHDLFEEARRLEPVSAGTGPEPSPEKQIALA